MVKNTPSTRVPVSRSLFKVFTQNSLNFRKTERKKKAPTKEITFHANSQHKNRSFHQTHWGRIHNRLGNPETKMLKEMAAESKAGES